MSKVGIIGVGQSSFVRSYPGSIRELAFEAYSDAMRDAQITNDLIDATVICSSPEYDKQRSPAGVVAGWMLSAWVMEASCGKRSRLTTVQNA